MSGQPLVRSLEFPASRVPRRTISEVLSDYWALTKPEVNFLILITTSAGFYMGSASEERSFSFATLLNTLFGTLLVAGGTGTLNQYVERRYDVRMRRTASRPSAAGRIAPHRVLAFGIGLSIAGAIYLGTTAGPRASMLAMLTSLTYLFVYTPLKRVTPLCVLVGALPGAVPPVIGWVAATGRLSVEAASLYLILFFWQFPHFMAIAWMYREDYERAGYFVLPQGRSRVPLLVLQTLLPLAGLISIGFIQSPRHDAAIFDCLSLLLGAGFLYTALIFVASRSRHAARHLLLASIVYLPLVYAVNAAFCDRF